MNLQQHVDDQMKSRGLQATPHISRPVIDLPTGNRDVQITETGRPTLAQPTGNGYVQITETRTGLPLLPQPTGNGYVQMVTETGNAQGIGTGSDGENQSTDQL